jgi:glyoxylase I family protein
VRRTRSQEDAVAPLHHAAICVHDLDASMAFYRDGLGLEVLMDHEFDGDWRALFDAPENRLRSVFLASAGHHDAGIVELVQLAGLGGVAPAPGPVRPGFFLLSFFVDVELVLARLAELGLGGAPRRITVPGPEQEVAMATVRDPDGVLVELIGAPTG